ncbi:MAG: hypothetical protein QW569_05530 [Candidatus Bathyarchaeia archaeon]|nr:hypothetical protein [Candidatus Bathyarchaeota archaeon]
MTLEVIGVIGILIIGLAVIVRVYTSKKVPKVIKGILWFLALFGVGDGIYLLSTWRYPFLFHLWSTGILFMVILLIIAGV